MKKLLPILLCYVLMTTQAYAISGGPVFGGGGLNPVGTYSGVINVTKELDNDDPVVDPVTGNLVPSEVADVNAIGLFDLGVPTVSVATGSFLLFVDGVVYTGTITASVDPDSDKLSGIVEGTFGFTVETINDSGIGFTTVVTDVTALASGQITAGISGTKQGTIASALITGVATINVDNSGLTNGQFHTDSTLDCTVSGFRQALTASAATTLASQ